MKRMNPARSHDVYIVTLLIALWGLWAWGRCDKSTLTSVEAGRLSRAVGGTCYVCSPLPACLSSTCHSSGSSYIYQTGTGAVPAYCTPGGGKGIGYQTCTTGGPQKCATVHTCKYPNCTTCTDQDTQVNTQCIFGPGC